MNFLALLSVLFFSHAGVGIRCVDVFAKDATLHQIPRMSSQNVPYETSELSRHGTVLSLSNSKQVDDYKNILLSRDGLYVFLLERSGTMAIDHHLPLPIDYSKASFHGTHRGLLRPPEQDFLHLGKAEVVFAGELMVLGGKVVWVSDDSVFYYDAPKVPQQRGETVRDFRIRTLRDNENARRVANNRLGLVQKLLLNWGWIDGSTKIKQIEESLGDTDYSTRQWGHIRSRKLALFERACRVQRQCWDTFLSLQSQVQRLANLNGLEPPKEIVQQLAKLDSRRAVLLFHFLSTIRESGISGVLSQQLNLKTGEPMQTLQDFMVALDWYVEVLQESH